MKISEIENKWEIPTVCPICGTEVEINSTGEVYCPNPNCEQKVIHKVQKFVNVNKIMKIGPAIITDLIKRCKITTISQFIFFVKSAQLDAVAGEKNGAKIRKNFSALMNQPISFGKFFAGFDIEDIGERKLNKLAEAGYKVADFLDDKMPAWKSVDNWSLETYNKFCAGVVEKQADIQSMSTFFKVDGETANKAIEGVLSGKAFCFTGKCATYQRSELEKMVVDRGGTVTAVNKDLYALVTDDPTNGSSKNVKAQKLGSKVISYEDFLKMCK